MIVLPILFLFFGGLYFIGLYFIYKFSDDISLFLNRNFYIPTSAMLSFALITLAGIFGIIYMMEFEKRIYKNIYLLAALGAMGFHIYFAIESMIFWKLSFRREIGLLLSGDLFSSLIYFYFLTEELIEVIQSHRRGESGRSNIDAR